MMAEPNKDDVVASYPVRPHLEDSRPLRWSVKASTDAAKDAVAHLMALMLSSEQRTRVRRADDLARLERTMEAMALDLFLAGGTRRPHLSYSRGKSDYAGGKLHPFVTLTSVTNVADFLIAAGFAEGFRGSYSRRQHPFGPGEVGTGYFSRLRATPLLMDLMASLFGVDGQDIAGEDLAAPLELRDRPDRRGDAKRLLQFTPTPATRQMEARVLQGNRLRASVAITAPGHQPQPGDTDLRRVFNNGDWQQGGRFFGGWWMEIGRERRSKIEIDGEPTVELDFKAFQPRICYHLVGQPLPREADPYAVPGYDSGRYRDTVKQTFGRLLNSGPGGPLSRRGVPKKLFRTAEDFRRFAERVEDAFAPIAGWLRCGRGMELQWIDSEIADEALARLTAATIPCLPVHDSFIVPRSAEQALARAMTDAYETVLSRFTGVVSLPAIAGWSSSKEEQAWRLAVDGLGKMEE